MKSWLRNAALVCAVASGFYAQSALAICMYQPGSAAQMQCEAHEAAQQLEAQQQQYGQQSQVYRKADSWGAVAMDAQGGSYGYASKQASKQASKLL